LTRRGQQIDPNDLAEAVAAQASSDDLDYRTRMLIHDSVAALRNHWGGPRVQQWLAQCPAQEKIEEICREEFDKIGFPSLKRRVMDKLPPEKVRQFFEYLGQRIRMDLKIYVAGSIALILTDHLQRHTEDVDIVDEIPEEIRDNHELMNALPELFKLELGHVQSHYLPSGWIDRVHYFDDFDRLRVYLLDVYDVFLSKLFSARVKDMSDLLVLAPQLDKEMLVEKLKTTCRSFLTVPGELEKAQKNWRVLFLDDLPI
jgi:Nucleotidyltransferase of unknown function (DUF6036)